MNPCEELLHHEDGFCALVELILEEFEAELSGLKGLDVHLNKESITKPMIFFRG